MRQCVDIVSRLEDPGVAGSSGSRLGSLAQAPADTMAMPQSALQPENLRQPFVAERASVRAADTPRHRFVASAGSRHWRVPAERLMRRLGLPQSDDTMLRSLKRQTANRGDPTPVRVVGIDDWSWLKGTTYGTIMVDLERREVLDVLADRSADGTAAWLARRPGVEVVSRDRCGLYAQAAMRGAPQARQVADRFHLIQNLRQSIQQQLSRAPLQHEPFVPGEMEPEPRQPQPGLIHRYGQPEVTEHQRLAIGVVLEDVRYKWLWVPDLNLQCIGVGHHTRRPPENLRGPNASAIQPIDFS
jgi:hypothetical protein